MFANNPNNILTIKLPCLQLIAQMEKSHDCYIFDRYFSSLYPILMKHFRYLSKFDLESKSNLYSSQIDIPEVPIALQGILEFLKSLIST